MTEKQGARLQNTIKSIKATLAAEKKRFGGYDDSRGLRYLPPQYYLQLGDYKGGATYFKWFEQNFPDDGGWPDFLFEWTVVLFKIGKTKEAEKKAFATYCSNTYVFDKFFGHPMVPIKKYEGSNIQQPDYTRYFTYTAAQPQLADFADWLRAFLASERFITARDAWLRIAIQLKTEPVGPTRTALVVESRQIEEGF